MSPPPSNGRAARWVQWLLLVPPCLPGALLLLLGGSLRSARDPAAALFARQQADQLHAAGLVVLAAGLLMAAFIAWKIVRPTPPDDGDGKDALDSR